MDDQVLTTDNAAAVPGSAVQFDGTVNEGGLDGRAVTFVSKRIDENSYEVILTDKETGEVSHTFKYMVVPDAKTLTFTWMKAGADKPL